MKSWVWWLGVLAASPAVSACNMQAAEASHEEKRATAAASATPQALRFGNPITADMVPLSELAKNPAAFKGKTVATTGIVAAVCHERGCWMEIKDGAADVNVRMHSHAFFVPRDSRGKKARVEGQVLLVKDGKECDEMEATGAQVQFDATGVVFDPA